MTSCTIIVSHFESLPFLRACIRQIRKYRRDDIYQYIVIADQSSDGVHGEVMKEFGWSNDISVVRTSPFYSGFGIDYLIRKWDRFFSTHICQLHVDAFPVHKNWLYIPIKLIEYHGFSFVGQHQFVCDGRQSIYPPDKFFAMSQCFNVAKTKTYKEMSREAGFTRFHNRPQSGLTFNNNDWDEWAKEDYKARGSDDDVVAFHWEDKYRQHDKLGLAITGMINTAEQGGSFGRVIEDIVFHFGSARESIGVFDKMPIKYQEYYRRIQEGFTDELLDKMLAEIKPNNYNRTIWSGVSKFALGTSEYLNNIIEELKIK